MPSLIAPSRLQRIVQGREVRSRDSSLDLSSGRTRNRRKRFDTVAEVQRIGVTTPEQAHLVETSLLHWVAKHRIPMVIPGLSDGSIGAQLFMHRQKNPNFMVDFLADEQILSDLTWTAEESHALMVGGGISKHHVIWWNQYRDGLDSAVGITTAPEHDGSLSGARLKEAISWGKIRPDAPHVTVEGDASVLLPILGADLFGE